MVLHDVDEEIVMALKHRATIHGVSEEEELRRVLEREFCYTRPAAISAVDEARMKERLTSGPDFGPEYDGFFERKDEYPAEVDWG